MDAIKIEKVSSEGLKSVYEISVSAESVEDQLNAEAREKGKNFRMPGFRPGHVPISVIRNRFKDEVKKGALDKIVSGVCNKIIKDSKIEELAVRPNYSLKHELEDNKELNFNITIEVAPDFELKPYDFEISKVVPNVPQSDIDEFRKNIIKDNPIYEDADDGCTIQSSSKVTYKAIYCKNGKSDTSKNINNATIVVPQNVPDSDKFSNLLIGKKIKDEFYFSPSNQPDISYKVSIEKIEKPIKDIKPEEYAVKVGFKDLAEWDSQIKRHIEGNINSQAYLYHKSQIIEALMKDYSFDLPQTVIERETQIVLAQIKAEREGRKKKGETVEEKTDEELKEEYKDTIDKRVLLGYIFNKIARKEGAIATDDELNQVVSMELSQNPRFASQILEYYRQNPALITYKRAEITEHKVIEFLVSHVKTKDEPLTLKEVNEKVQKLLEEDDDDPAKH